MSRRMSRLVNLPACDILKLMKLSIAITLLTGLILLSFLGAAMTVHHGVAAGGCLASALRGAICPEILDVVAAASFHSQMFVGLFVVILSAAVILSAILAVRFLIFDFNLVGKPSHLALAGLANDLAESQRKFLRYLSIFEHSPTLA